MQIFGKKKREICSVGLMLLVTSCAKMSLPERAANSASRPLTLAVWDFDNSSFANADSVDYLSKVLSEMLLAELAQVPGIHLVDRVKLREALEEQRLGSSELASEETRLKLGRIAGANHMAFGHFMAVGEQIRVDVRVVDVETSLIKFSEDVATTPQDIAKQMQTVARHLQSKLGENAAAGMANSVDMATWRHYEAGVALMDQHRYDEAIAVFKAVLTKQPDFKAAEQQIKTALDKQMRQ
jgi:curli biogenesis system outer membrane secretion channel CsgG